MASLMELVDRVNRGELIDSAQLEVYQESPNSAEKFLAHHAHAMLELRRAHQHMLSSLEAIDYADQKVLTQFMSVASFLNQTDMRAGPVVKFGASAIARREYGLGLEAIQNGIAFDLAQGGAYTADRENCQFVATQYGRAAQCIGWAGNAATDWNNKTTTVALVVSGIGDDDGTGRAIRSLAKHLDKARFTLRVYSTEAAVRRDKTQFAQVAYVAGSAKRGEKAIDFLTKNKVNAWLAPTDGDVTAAAKALADQLAADHVDVALFDATQADPIAAVVADWNVARVKINLARRAPLFASGVDCVTYTDPARYEADKDFWQRQGVEAKFVLEGIDVDQAALGAAPQRSAYGIPEQAVVMATSGSNLDESITGEFVDTVINILRAHPHAIYLLIGEGELTWQKRKFEQAGVGKRVGYAGKRKDLPGFLRIADLYLAEFPAANASGVLQAMAMEKPVVAMRYGDSPEQSQAASFVGSEGTVGRDPAAYIERVSKILREAPYRRKLGNTMRHRVEQHFAYNQTARHLEQLMDQLIQQSTEAEVSVARTEDDEESGGLLTQVA
ncbi:MAG TPA: glycosyltransferase [Tepidisphaeraceae bacterium]|nr:glycosyltransferase [Tepidisphaeraceae bacterium]